MVNQICYTWQKIANGRAAADKARRHDPAIPGEIKTRWVCAYDALDKTVQLGGKILAAEPIQGEEPFTRADILAAQAARALLERLHVATLELEKDSSTVFDVVRVFAYCFAGDVANDTVFNKVFGRNCYAPALVAACAMSPLLAPELLQEPLRMMLRECVRDCLFSMDPDFSDQRVEQELRELLEGSMQRCQRTKLPSDRAGVAAFVAGLPYMSVLAAQLLNVPSSSANVERSFSMQARCHTSLRMSLSEASVTSQMLCCSFLQPLSAAMPEPPSCGSMEDVALVIGWCYPEWVKVRAAKLKPEDKLLVWYECGGKLKPYRCTLKEEVAGGAWRVVWQADRSTQQLRPTVDYWCYQSEA